MQIALIFVACLAIATYFMVEKANKRIHALEISLDELGKAAAGTGAAEGYV